MEIEQTETEKKEKNSENLSGPLVSIIVITYNSAKYVLETLESAKAQTYQNIELIISDDCSKDNTVAICKSWIKKNKARFIKTELITVEKNTGTSANCNRGVKVAQGEWMKLIAGDDALYEDAIENLLSFALLNNAMVVHSNHDTFNKSFEPKFKINNIRTHNYHMTSNLASAKEQFSFLLWTRDVHAPTVLINKELLYEVGFFDERISLFEDHPMWLKITLNGNKIFYLEKKTVKYRIHEDSVTERINRTRVIPNTEYQVVKMYKYYVLPNVNFITSIFIRYEMIRRYIVFNTFLNKYNLFNDYFNRITSLPYRKMVQYKKENNTK